jgi:hypothetical protein
MQMNTPAAYSVPGTFYTEAGTPACGPVPAA